MAAEQHTSRSDEICPQTPALTCPEAPPWLQPSPENLRVRCLTYNVAGYPPTGANESVLEGLLGVGERNAYDVLAIGFQEVHARVDKLAYDSLVSGQDEWTAAVTTVLHAKQYVRVRSLRVLGTILNVFVHLSHLLHLRDIDTSYVRLSFPGFKAGLAIRFRLYGNSLCFVGSHLSAHDHQLKERNSEYHYIVNNVKFRKNDAILDHDFVIWLGDLNYRLQQPETFTAQEIIMRIKRHDKQSPGDKSELAPMLEHDQLRLSKSQDAAFSPMLEDEITFSPTYKFIVGRPEYTEKRRPAWTDRILYRSTSDSSSLKTSNYRSHPNVLLSDHCPVSLNAEFRVLHNEAQWEELRAKSDAPLPPYRYSVKFHPPGKWIFGRENEAAYTVSDNAIPGSWDWIGLFRSGFASLEDYLSFTWGVDPAGSGLRRAVFFNIPVPASHEYVLVYFGENGDVLGMSENFVIVNE